jgi:hypothetical protein
MDPDLYYVFRMLGFNIVLSSFDILRDAIEDFRRGAAGLPSIRPRHAEQSAPSRAPVIDIAAEEEGSASAGSAETGGADATAAGEAASPDEATDETAPVKRRTHSDVASSDFVDFEESPTVVNVDGGVTDNDVEEDKEIREMGWDHYGEELRKKMKKPKGDSD